MRVELMDDVFTDASPAPGHITAVFDLLTAFERGQHDWVIDDLGVEAVATYLPRHHPTLADTYTSMAQMAAVQVAYTSTTQASDPVRVTRDDLRDHSNDLCRPAIVVVEDLSSDGDYFLPALVHVFGADRIRKALEEGWLEIRHGGGVGRIPTVAAAEAARFRRVVRVVAFMDSDRETPDHESDTLKSADKTRAIPIEVHVLTFREAENYVPDKVLRQVGKSTESAVKVAALARLPRQHRRHVDIKNGFKKGFQPPHQRTAFGAVPNDVLNDLKPGFGGTVLRTLFEMRLDLCEDDFVAMDPEAADDLRKLLALIDSRI
jgi:hypothetical protein